MEILRWKTRIAVLWIIHMVSFAAYLILSSLEPQAIAARQAGGTQINEGGRLLISIFFLVPWLMAWLSLTLKDAANRWTNFALSILLAVILLIVLIRGRSAGVSAALQFNLYWGIVVAVLIFWYAWKWPKAEA